MNAAPPIFSWTDASVRAALGLTPPAASGAGIAAAHVFGAVSTDTRSIGPGDLYVALVGERFDGHDFVAEAIAKGAAGAVVSRPVTGVPAAALYVVDDTLVALGHLARHRRRALPAQVVGIGGSAGKTTTKDLVAAALGAGLRVHATYRNLNNRVGVPLTLLSAPDDAEVLVVEMGTSIRGEMKALTAIAEPDVAVLVTVGAEHLEGLGSVDDAIEEELDMLRALPPRAVAIVGDDPVVLPRRARALADAGPPPSHVRVAGWSARADTDLRPAGVEVDEWGHHSFSCLGARVDLRVAGCHAVTNALLALAVADELGVDPEAAARALGTVAPSGMRGELRHLGALTLVLDCYNANPQSVRAALELFAVRAPGRRHVCVLGSMLELGAAEADLHEAVLKDALARGFALVVATGHFASAAERLGAPAPAGTQLIAAHGLDEAWQALAPHLEGNEVVLLKGSRGVALERMAAHLEARFGPPRGDA